jgi:glycerophosphoryl diester phosphodiesterase
MATRPIAVYGGERPVGHVRARLPQILAMSGSALKRCILRYLAVGWSGRTPFACRKSIVLLPYNYAGWVWGWPNRFLARMKAAGTEVFAVGRWGGEGFSRGIDRPNELREFPPGYAGGIWTHRIDRIAPLVR